MMKNYAGLIMAILGMLLTTQELKASHAMGADLTYVCTGPNQYQINLSFFRDCNGIVPDGSYLINISSASCGSDLSLTVNQVGSPTIITPLCPSEEDECITNALYGVEQYIYTGTITLPPGCDDWELSWLSLIHI